MKTTEIKSASIKAEYEVICKVLAQCKNNKSVAAKILNINRKTLYNKIKRYQDLPIEWPTQQ